MEHRDGCQRGTGSPGRGAPSPPPAPTPPLAGVPQGRPPPSPTVRASVRAGSPSDPMTLGLQERRPCGQSASGSPSSQEGVCKHPAKPRNCPPENTAAQAGALRLRGYSGRRVIPPRKQPWRRHSAPLLPTLGARAHAPGWPWEGGSEALPPSQPLAREPRPGGAGAL